MQSWSLIIFGFNEGKSIDKVVRDAYVVLQKVSNEQGEIIVVDDGSTDNTMEVIEKMRTEIPCMKTIIHTTNKGIGAALMSGYRAASGENVCAIPADGQFEISQLYSCSDIPPNTIVSFFREKNDIYSPFRKFLSWSNRKILKHVFQADIKDVNWVKVYKKANLDNTVVNASSSIIESELCVKILRSGSNLIEIPTVYLPRSYGVPKGASLKTMTNAIFDLPGLFFSLTEIGAEKKHRK